MYVQRKLILFLAVLAWLGTQRAEAGCSANAATWQCWEGTIPLASTGTNPYRDLKVRVDLCPNQVCTASSTNKLTTYAFWDGGNQLKFRVAFPSSATWYWTSACEAGCSFTQSGQTPLIPAYSGTANPLYQYGFLQPSLQGSTKGRYLIHSVPKSDGTDRVFVWLGDMVWSGPLRSTASDWRNYLTDRKNRGFSVLQIAIPVDWMQTAGQQPRYGTSPGQPAFHKQPCGSGISEDNVNPMPRSSSCWNPSFWQSFEQKVWAANDQGLAVVLVGLMEGVIEKNSNGKWCPPVLADSEVFARNIAARFAGNHVIFSPAFDRYSGSSACAGAGKVIDRVRAIGNVIATTAPRALATNHWASQTSGNEVLGLQDDGWLDFQLFQSGQAGYVCSSSGDPAVCQPKQLATLSCRARQLALCVWNHSCTATPTSCPDVTEVTAPSGIDATKPGVNGESIADGSTGKASLGSLHYNPLNARRTGYYSLLSGAAGYTFAVEGLWNWGLSSRTPASSWATRSNNHMQYLGGFFRSITNLRALTPSQGILVTQQPAEEHRKLTVARGSGGGFLIAYLPDNPQIQLDFTNLPNLRTNGRWLNPRTGMYSTATAAVSGTTYTYTRPLAPPVCPPAGTSDPLLVCSGEPATDPCYCSDSSNSNRGERDWVLVIP